MSRPKPAAPIPARSAPQWFRELDDLLDGPGETIDLLGAAAALLAARLLSSCAIFRRMSGGELSLVCARSPSGSGEEWTAGSRRAGVDELAGRVAEHVSPVYERHGREQALLGVPLHARGGTAGVLVLVRNGPASRFSPAERRRAGGAARALAAAVARVGLEVKAAESEALLDAIMELVSDAIVSTDEGQRITRFSRGAGQTFGYAAAEVLGRRLDILLPARFRDEHRSAVGEFARSDIPVLRMSERRGLRGLRKDGREFPAEVSVSRTKVGDQTIFNAVLRDLTPGVRDRKLLARALGHAERARAGAEAGEARARLLADASGALPVTLDEQATIAALTRMTVPVLADLCIGHVLAEDGRLALVGVAHADPAAEPRLQELARDGPLTPEVGEALARVLETGGVELVACVPSQRRKQGTERRERALHPRSFTILPLRAGERTLGTITLVYGRSGRRYQPSDLPLIRALADRAALAVENARLYTRARDAARARDETLRVVAHDIGNSLSAAQLHASVCVRQLSAGAETAAAREHAEQIEHLMVHLQRLRQDLLDAASLEAGALSMRPGPVDVGELVEEALKLIEPLAVAKGITLDRTVSPGLRPVQADMERLLQALGNLLGNAIKFTPDAGRVAVAARPVDDGVEIDVSDSGPGIEPELLPHVFDRFWRAPGVRTGSGLGLAITRGVVEAHGGRISASVRPGEGSTFRITLPAAPTAP